MAFVKMERLLGTSMSKKDTSGDWIILPADMKTMSVIVDATGSGNIGRAEVTNDIDTVLADGTVIAKVAWTPGDITNAVSSDSVDVPVKAIRLVKTNTATLYITVS